MGKTLKRATVFFVTLAMAAGLCIGLAACGGAANNDEQMIKSELDKAFSTLKNPTDDSIKELIGSEDAGLDELAKMGVDPIEMLKHFFGKFDYSIDSVKVDGDKGTATVTTTNVDFQAVMNETLANLQNDQEFMEQVLNSSGDETELYKLVFAKLYDAIDKSDKLVTDTFEIGLEKKDGTWGFTDAGQQTLMAAMFGGMDFSSL